MVKEYSWYDFSPLTFVLICFKPQHVVTWGNVPCHLKRIHTLQLLGGAVPYVYKVQFVNCAVKIIYMFTTYVVCLFHYFSREVC